MSKLCCAFVLSLCATPAAIAGPPGEQRVEVLSRIHLHRAVLDRSKDAAGGIAGACDPLVRAHTDSDFQPGEYIVQAGFVEGEIAATSFVLPAEVFPVKFDMAEMIFGTAGTNVETTTAWGIHIWSGLPNGSTPLESFYSDGLILPHAVVPPGNSGLHLQFVIDAGDPDQIWIADDGSHTVTIGFEIVSHNNQSGTGCISAPPSTSNAFPTTDTDGLSTSSGNWIYVFDCGIFGCPAGWKRFQDLPSVCRPSGDWIQRLTVTPSLCDSIGACCFDSDCLQLDQATCETGGGVFHGSGVSCSGIDCSNTVPCCFKSTGGCVQLEGWECEAAGGSPGLPGASCDDIVCFPIGACCLADGSCEDGLTPEECAALSGTFQGDATECSTTDCPEPVGAACFSTGFCLVLTELEATAAGASWMGAGTTCSDGNGDGTADACEDPGVPGDFNGDGVVNGADLGIFLASWGGGGQTDLNGDGTTNGADLGLLLTMWTG